MLLRPDAKDWHPAPQSDAPRTGCIQGRTQGMNLRNGWKSAQILAFHPVIRTTAPVRSACRP